MTRFLVVIKSKDLNARGPCTYAFVIEDNVNVAIHLMFELFISIQKFGVLKTLQKVRDRSIIFRLNQLGDLIIMTM
jgi:hypothetical protein